MKFTCVLPDQQGTIIEFARNPFIGSLSIKANGQVVYSKSAFSLLAQFDPALRRNYEFSLPGSMLRHVCITKERPLLLAGFRRNRYHVIFNGQNIGDYIGF
jgi:hypothetical protein